MSAATKIKTSSLSTSSTLCARVMTGMYSMSEEKNGGNVGGNEPAVIDGIARSNTAGQSSASPIDRRTADHGTLSASLKPSNFMPSALPSTVDALGSNWFSASQLTERTTLHS